MMKIGYSQAPNVEALVDELQAQFPGAVSAYGAEEGGVVYVQNVEDTIENHAAVEAILAAHDPSVKTDVQVAIEQIETVRASARTELANVPNWAIMTGAEASAWISANVIDLASAKVALSAMARMLVALRNELYPDLQE